MIAVSLSPHREYLLANTPNQKHFVLLEASVDGQARTARARQSVVFAVDTSASMKERAAAGRTKLELVVEALENLLTSGVFSADDYVALVKFDSVADVVLPLVPIGPNPADHIGAMRHLLSFSGGTQMGAGMHRAADLIVDKVENPRMILLTDGQTFDEEVVVETTKRLFDYRMPVTAFGVGNDWNEGLLTWITDYTQGRPFHIVPDDQHPLAPSIRASSFPQVLAQELQVGASEVVRDLRMTVRTVKDVHLERVTRVHPTQSEVDLSQAPYRLGNVSVRDGAAYILEFTLPGRPQARIRMGQLGLTYRTVGSSDELEHPPVDVAAEFVEDEAVAARVDAEVMKWIQQRNVESLIRQAATVAERDPAQAQNTLRIARAMTERLGNGAMTRALDQAATEITTTKSLSAGTLKTLRIGAKTQTIRASSGAGLSDDEIRKATGA